METPLDLEQYRASVRERIRAVLPALQRAAIGDFSMPLPIPQVIDEFTPLYVGINIVTEDLSALFHELQSAKSRLEHSVAAGADELDKAIIELQESHARTRSILANAGEGIVAVDVQGKVLLVNQAAVELAQTSEVAVVGKQCQDVFYCRALEADLSTEEPISRFIATHLQRGEKIVRKLCELIRRDGSTVPVEVVASPIISHGQIDGAVIIFRDTRAEREIEKVKSDLVSFASHQLLTPLTAIHGYAELLKEDAHSLSPDAQHAIGRIIESTERMKDVIQSFLNVSAIEAEGFQLRQQHVVIPPLLTALIAECGAVGLKRRLHMELVASSSDTTIIADSTYLSMAIQNLLSNAIKYTPEGGHIHVRCFEEVHEAVIEVEDTGCGIPKEEQEKIFQKMFRAKNAQHVSGTGLGLYLVQKIVKQFHGTILFESEVGKGTTFMLRFPLVEKQNTTETNAL